MFLGSVVPDRVDADDLELEPSETAAIVIIRWPDKPTVLQPTRFREAAASITQLFTRAHSALAAHLPRNKLAPMRQANCATR
jgi:hypothetical protein